MTKHKQLKTLKRHKQIVKETNVQQHSQRRIHPTITKEEVKDVGDKR